jgi:sec-independent protein translocase protein TatA
VTLAALLFLNLGTSEIMLILFVVLLLFGANKIPELARGLGKGMREFKDATNGIQREIQESARKIEQEGNQITKDIAKDQPDITAKDE